MAGFPPPPEMKKRPSLDRGAAFFRMQGIPAAASSHSTPPRGEVAARSFRLSLPLLPPHAVRTYLNRIFRKSKVTNRAGTTEFPLHAQT